MKPFQSAPIVQMMGHRYLNRAAMHCSGTTESTRWVCRRGDGLGWVGLRRGLTPAGHCRPLCASPARHWSQILCCPVPRLSALGQPHGPHRSVGERETPPLCLCEWAGGVIAVDYRHVTSHCGTAPVYCLRTPRLANRPTHPPTSENFFSGI